MGAIRDEHEHNYHLENRANGTSFNIICSCIYKAIRQLLPHRTIPIVFTTSLS